MQHLRFKLQAPIFEHAVFVIEILVDHAGIHDFLGALEPFFFAIKKIDVQLHLDAFQHLLDNRPITADRNALIAVIEVVVVIGEADGEAFDDEGRQVFGRSPPLLLGIAFDQFFVYIGSDERNRLFLQVSRLGDASGLPLLLDFKLGFVRGDDAPQFIEGVHVEGQIV
ncbi:hypothetical protein D3C77_465110 [compost metagenome]